jgi:hypothetical protein
LEKDKLDVGIADMDPEELIPLQEEAAKEEEKVRGREGGREGGKGEVRKRGRTKPFACA